MRRCKTEQRFTGIACEGLHKGHDGPHNWPESDDPVKAAKVKRTIPISELSIDERIELVAEGLRADCETFMLTALENESMLNFAADRVRRGEQVGSLRLFRWAM